MATRSNARAGRKGPPPSLDRTVFVLDETTFQRFVKSLDSKLNMSGSGGC